jgi:glycosyltransferase involved in cell wall biosynthesis
LPPRWTGPTRRTSREIGPLLDHPFFEFVGGIGDVDKAAFLGGALALLFPIDWPEPFGLAMIEAMACGTPVVARPCGSVPEVLRPGETGFIAGTVDEMVEAVKRIDLIDRAACRRWVEQRFSVEGMVDAYEEVYARVHKMTRALLHIGRRPAQEGHRAVHDVDSGRSPATYGCSRLGE